MTAKRDSHRNTRTRMLLLARRLYAGETITYQDIQREFEITSSSAKRDIAVIRMLLPVDAWRPRYHEPTRVRIPRNYTKVSA